MWEGMITVLGSAYAFIVLGERFTSWIQYVGVVLAILSVWMVHCGDCK
jgi:multidrug transporter EmrE-like cation transporter